MRNILFKLFRDLEDNDRNRIFFFRAGRRYERTYAGFSQDVDKALRKLDHLREKHGHQRVALIGPVSYDWIVCDMACIKGGFLTIAIPETLPPQEVDSLICDTKADIVLMDFSLVERYPGGGRPVFYFECPGPSDDRFWDLPESTTPQDPSVNRLLDVYSIVFSSGTSGKTKQIARNFPSIFGDEKPSSLLYKIKAYWARKTSIWSRKDNKLIIFMPFSHSQQRDFFRTALMRNIDIILSDQNNCLKHIITEKPNMMVSVPLIYEVMATRISEKIRKFGPLQRICFRFYNGAKINTLPDRIWIKRLFSVTLFRYIRKIYGGRADYFITGSAAISPDTLRTFYSVGVKILQAYGQTEIGRLSMSTPRHFRIGSVGKPNPEVKIGEDSEILVWYNDWFYSGIRDILNIEDQYIRTGDLGYIDKDGYLFITGRKDEVIVLDNGKKVFPEKIESLLRSSDLVEEACVFEKEGYKLHAVVKCRPNSKEQEIKRHLQSVNSKLMLYEQIRSFTVAGEKFSVDNGLLTSTFKKKRQSIRSAYEKNNAIPV